MRCILILLLITYTAACKKESSTRFEAYLINKSGHSIEIKPYFNGFVSTVNIMRLQQNDTLQIADGFYRGISSDSSAGFIPKYFAGADSLIVVFDNTYSITHYINTPSLLNSKYYLFTSQRNIGNPRSYQMIIKSSSSTFRENEFWYTFTQQDYLDAQ